MAPDAVGKMIEFENELVHHFELLLEPFPLNFAKEPALLFERERGVQRRPSFVAVNLHEGSGLGAVARSALANQPFRMCETEGDAVLDFAEALSVVSPDVRRRFDRGVSRKPAHGVDAINAKVDRALS